MHQHNWILLRGLTRESGHWGEFLTQFEQAMPASRVTALDLPGNGQLFQQRSPVSVQVMLEHCRQQLKAQSVAPPYHFLAMSLGAMVVVAWAQVYPHEVTAHVLINTSMRPFSPFYERLRSPNYITLLKLILLDTSAQQWESAILRMTTQHAHGDVLSQWLALRQAHPVSRANAFRQLIAAARFCATPDRCVARVLLLASEADQLVNVHCSKVLAEHWQCALRLHPTAGHDLPLDAAPWVIEQVRQWLDNA
jgi:pimeloyl-ACP methyl ester carboxylesterase